MTSRKDIEDFLAQRQVAVVGASRSRRKFGNIVFRNLKAKGYQVYPINKNTREVEGEVCYPSLTSLPSGVSGAVIVVPPSETEQVVREAAAAGIRRVWMQQGSESEEAIRFCRDNGIRAVHGHCILMFAQPVGLLHRVHRWLWKVLGKLPA